MLSTHDVLDSERIKSILAQGHSRLPVYRYGGACLPVFYRCVVGVLSAAAVPVRALHVYLSLRWRGAIVNCGLCHMSHMGAYLLSLSCLRNPCMLTIFM